MSYDSYDLENEEHELIVELCGLKESEAAWIARVLGEELYFELWSIAKSKGQDKAVKLLGSSTSDFDFFQKPKEVFRRLLEIQKTEELLQQLQEVERRQELRRSQQNQRRQKQQQEIQETEELLQLQEEELQIAEKKCEGLLQKFQTMQRYYHQKLKKEQILTQISEQSWLTMPSSDGSGMWTGSLIDKEMWGMLNSLPLIIWKSEHLTKLLESMEKLKESLLFDMNLHQLLENRGEERMLNAQKQQIFQNVSLKIDEELREYDELREKLLITLQSLAGKSLEHPQQESMKPKQQYPQSLQAQIQTTSEHLQSLHTQIQQTKEHLEELQEDHKAQDHLQKLRKTKQEEEDSRLQKEIQDTKERLQELQENLKRDYGSRPNDQALSEISQSQQLSQFTGTPKPSSENDFDPSFGEYVTEKAEPNPHTHNAREDEGNER